MAYGWWMQGVVHWIQANDIPEWPKWSSPEPWCEAQWFSVTIGPPGDPGTNYFQVEVATPLGINERRDKKKFIGLVVDYFEPELVERAIRDFVANSQALTWQGIIDL